MRRLCAEQSDVTGGKDEIARVRTANTIDDAGGILRRHEPIAFAADVEQRAAHALQRHGLVADLQRAVGEFADVVDDDFVAVLGLFQRVSPNS